MKKILLIITMIFVIVANGYTQEEKSEYLYLGPGIGLDYGGMIGAKIEFLPIKYLGLFGGAGYNLLSLGWNVGGSFKVLPDSKITPVLDAFYGYNAVFVVTNSDKYEMTSYGPTFGIGIDLKLGKKGHKLSANLFVPVRSKKFMDNYEEAKEDPNITIDANLLPIAASIGFNFNLGH